MRVLVTGAAGFIGSHLSAALLDEGDEVVGVDGFLPLYERWRKEANLAPLLARPGFSFHELDLRSAELEPVVEGCRAVVHLAAMAGLSRSWTELELYSGCNIAATQRLLEAVRRVGVERLVHISTSSVYGAEAVGDEDRPTRPISPYGITKLAAEHLVKAYDASQGIPWLILRYFSIYGPRQRPDMAYHRFIEALLDGRPITIYGDGRQTRSNTYIDDCVRGTLGALREGRLRETYNIGGGETIDVLGAVDVLAEAVGVRPELRFEPPQPGDQRHTAADTSRAARDFGYRPTVRPSEGLPLQAAWQRGLRAASSAEAGSSS